MGLRLEDYIPTPAMIRHRKVSSTSTPVSTVESWLKDNPDKRMENQENGGIRRSTGSVIFVDTLKADLAPSQRKKAKAKALRDYKQALRNLNAQKAQNAVKAEETQAATLVEAYRKFKRIAKDNDATISEILASKRG